MSQKPRNPARKTGGAGSSQNGKTFTTHQLCHTPGGRYGPRKEEKRKRAEERQHARAMRTPQEQLALLDERLGKNQGAKLERERLKKLIEAG